tara:strand:+ start:353 stop:499 length:147 start_codon:yes stop_codon:yes gene_type:complete
MFTLASIFSILFNGYGYKCYWEIEEKYNDYLLKIIDIEIKEEKSLKIS